MIIIDLDHNGAESTVHRLIALGAPRIVCATRTCSATANPRTASSCAR